MTKIKKKYRSVVVWLKCVSGENKCIGSIDLFKINHTPIFTSSIWKRSLNNKWNSFLF